MTFCNHFYFIIKMHTFIHTSVSMMLQLPPKFDKLIFYNIVWNFSKNDLVVEGQRNFTFMFHNTRFCTIFPIFRYSTQEESSSWLCLYDRILHLRKTVPGNWSFGHLSSKEQGLWHPCPFYILDNIQEHLVRHFNRIDDCLAVLVRALFWILWKPQSACQSHPVNKSLYLVNQDLF